MGPISRDLPSLNPSVNLCPRQLCTGSVSACQPTADPALGCMSTLGVRALFPALARLQRSHLPFQPTCLSQVHVFNLLLLKPRIVQAPPHQIIVCLPPKAFLPFHGHCFGDGATMVVKPAAGLPYSHLRFSSQSTAISVSWSWSFSSLSVSSSTLGLWSVLPW